MNSPTAHSNSSAIPPIVSSSSPAVAVDSVASVRQILRLTYGVVPIVAGLDKFTHLLADWNAYLSPALARMLPMSGDTFMRLVGVIEIVAGVLVLLRPRIGARVVAAWLVAIALNLVISGHYFDVAVRDLVMAVGAWSLARLSAGETHA